MLYDVYVSHMRPGDEVEGYYVLKTAQPKVSNNGKPYLNATVADASGDMDCKVWDYSGPVGQEDEGKIIKLRGTVSEFRGALQLTIERLRVAGEHDGYDLSRLVPVAPIDVEEMFGYVSRLAGEIPDPDYRRVCLEMLSRHGEALRRIPAGKTVHHSFLSGLLMHTGNMLRQAEFLAGLYADTVDRSLLLAGTLLHDFGKEEEFLYSQLGLVTGYSAKGELLGHLVMGAGEVADIARELQIPEEKSVLLQHMLLSHHGEPEFGAAVKPVCAEAELLSFIDLIDSRMEIYRENMEKMEPGQFSQRIFALDKKIYKHA